MRLRDRRIGKFRISIDVIEKNPTLVKRIMGECIIIEAELKYIDDSIHYAAISDHFNKTELGEMVMEYDIIVIENKFMFTTYNDENWFQEYLNDKNIIA